MDRRASDRPIFSFESIPATFERYGDAMALIEIRGNDRLTHSYGDLATRAGAIGRGLLREGIEPGERVGLMAPNGAPWIIARLAISIAGAVAVAIDDLADAAETAMNIRTSGLRRLFTMRAHMPMLQELARDLGTQLILMDDDAAENDAALSCSALGARHHGRLPPLAPDGPAMLVHTSGTTGSPRPFLLTNCNIEVNVNALADIGLLGQQDRVLLPLPLHHVYPFVVGLLVPFAIGATVVLPEAATGPKMVRALELTGATTMIGVPRLYEALVAGMESQARARGKLPASLFLGLLRMSIAVRRRFGASPGRILFPQVHRRLGSLRLLVSAGAKLEEQVIWKLEGLGFRTLSGYGLGETASAFTGNIPGARRIGSEGKPLGRGRVRIADPDPEGIGEIQLQGPAVFDGYLDNPEANRAAFTEDGWFRTGDLGRLDADGYVYVKGRLKELIVLGGGKNVFPEELEKRYGLSSFIKEVAVLERNGRLVALVVPDTAAIRASPMTSIEAVVRVALGGAAKGLPSHQRLSGFAIARQPPPRTRLGKYQRHLLPHLYEEALAGHTSILSQTSLSEEDQALLAGSRAAAAWRVLQTRYSSRGLTLDSDPQLDLGIELSRMAEPGPRTGERSRHSDRRTGVRGSRERSRSPSTHRGDSRASGRVGHAGNAGAGRGCLARSEHARGKAPCYGYLRSRPRYRSHCLSAARERAGARAGSATLSHRRQPRQRSRPGRAGRQPAIGEAAEPVLERRAEPAVQHAGEAPFVPHRAYLPRR